MNSRGIPSTPTSSSSNLKNTYLLSIELARVPTFTGIHTHMFSYVRILPYINIHNQSINQFNSIETSKMKTLPLVEDKKISSLTAYQTENITDAIRDASGIRSGRTGDLSIFFISKTKVFFHSSKAKKEAQG